MEFLYQQKWDNVKFLPNLLTLFSGICRAKIKENEDINANKNEIKRNLPNKYRQRLAY